MTANPTLPRNYGTPITWTATATGGISPVQFRFWRFSVATGTWSLVQDYSTSNTFTWSTTLADVGQYSLQAWVRNAGSTANYDAWRATNTFSITDPAPTVTSLTANVSFPRVYGTQITWTARVSGGIAPLQYRFWRFAVATATWSMVRDYSTSNTYSWTPALSDEGQYALQVWVRNAGSTAQYDAWLGTPNFDITAPAPAINSFSANGTFPRPAGQPITWTVSASGGLAPLSYRFWRYSAATASWSIVQDFGASNTFSWIPGAAEVGQYAVQVWVKNAGSSIPYDAWASTGNFDITAPQPLSVSSLTVAPPVPKPYGSILQWTANASGGIAPLQYRFWRYSAAAGAWTLVQDYSASNTYVWTPTASDIGNYSIQAWVRSSGSNAAYDAWAGTPTFAITGSQSDIVRFLEQATFGPTDELINHVQQVGMAGYIAEQLALPPNDYPDLPAVPDSVPANCDTTCQRDYYSMYPLQRRYYWNALYSDDQLRQRVAWALHRLVVTSGVDITVPSWINPYIQTIYRNALGNYRQLLYEITLNPAMGVYLDMASSTKRNPNENYAREILQLFSIGTDLLYPDGTPQLNLAGDPVASYDQGIVTGFARVFTGWQLNPANPTGFSDYVTPMRLIATNHETGAKYLLNGTVLPANQTASKDLNDAIDNIFNHANVGPYISRHLIRSLVTSNPTPAYVGRVAAVFNNNGSGTRGDLGAVVRAILLDPEARRSVPVGPYYGHLREPALYVTGILRAFHAVSADGQALSDGYLNPQSSSMGQDVFRPPSVFSYYPADYLAPQTQVVGPEFGILSATTAFKRANFVNTIVFATIPVSGNAPQGTSLDLSVLRSIAGNPDALIQELDRLLLHDTMSPAMRTSVRDAVAAVPSSNPLLRAQTALYLVATSSQYQVEQ